MRMLLAALFCLIAYTLMDFYALNRGFKYIDQFKTHPKVVSAMDLPGYHGYLAYQNWHFKAEKIWEQKPFLDRVFKKHDPIKDAEEYFKPTQGSGSGGAIED